MPKPNNIGINIESAVPSGHVQDLSQAIVEIFKAAHDNHVEQKTIIRALDALAQGISLHATIASNSISQ